MLRYRVKLAAPQFVCHPFKFRHFKLWKSTMWRKFLMWQCLHSCQTFLFLLIQFFTWSVWPWNYTQRSQMCNKGFVTAVICKNFISKKWQNFNADKTFKRKNIWPKKHLPNENIELMNFSTFLKILVQPCTKLKRKLTYTYVFVVQICFHILRLKNERNRHKPWQTFFTDNTSTQQNNCNCPSENIQVKKSCVKQFAWLNP